MDVTAHAKPDGEVAERCRSLVGLLQHVQLLATLHPVDFFVHKLWEKALPADWRVALLHMGDEALRSLGTLQEGDPEELTRSSELGRGEPVEQATPTASQGTGQDLPLSQFLQQARRAVLRRACPSVRVNNDSSQPHPELGTSKKKAHEIALMADLVEKAVNQYTIDCVVDLGSGKGYLAEELANRGLKVVAIDSDPLNLKGAVRRHGLLAKTGKRRKRRAQGGVASEGSGVATSSPDVRQVCVHGSSCGALTRCDGTSCFRTEHGPTPSPEYNPKL